MSDIKVLNYPLNLGGIGDVQRLKDFKKESFPYHGIWCFTGSQGNGKTLALMHTLRGMIEAFPDAIVVSDIALYGVPCFPYKGVSDFEKYNNGEKGIIYVLDEIQTLFSSLSSSKMPESQIAIWSQNRKNKRVILGTTQVFGRIAKPIREQTTFVIKCAKPIFNLYRYRVIDGDSFDKETGDYIGDGKEPIRLYCPNFRTMSMYSTMEVVSQERGKYNVNAD